MSPLAILTGASSGIGAAAAEQFIDQGYSVVNISRRDCPIPGVCSIYSIYDNTTFSIGDQTCQNYLRLKLADRA